MKTMSLSDIKAVSGGWQETPWRGPFEVYRPGQPIDPSSPWWPPIPVRPF
jgi:hypothetical protein